MKPFKYLCFLLVLLTVVPFAACQSNEPDTENPFFKLKEDPAFVSTEEQFNYTRFNEQYADTLKPSEQYGELLPFVGNSVEYKSTKEGSNKTLKLPKYGLCNGQGAVVVDAVYDAVKKHTTDEGTFVYELIKGSDGSDPLKGERYLTAADGSWGFVIPKNCVFRSVGADRVILERTRTVKKVKYTYLDFYDFKGKRKFIFEKALAENVNAKYTVGAFSSGFAPVNVTVTDPEKKTKKSYAYYIDNTGKKYYEKFVSCSEFEKEYAVVKDEKGLFGVINTKGEWFLEPQYRQVNYNSEKGYFAAAKDGYFHIIDMEKKTVKSILCEKGSIEIINSENMIYKKTNVDTGRVEYFYMDSNKPFSCAETGQFPDSGESFDGVYVCTYSGTGTLFNEDGETVAVIGEFGEIADRFSNTVIVADKNDKKVCFVTVSTKQRTEWMKYRYTRECIDKRYIILQNPSSSKYSLYDIYSNTFIFENCDFMTVSKSGKTELLSVFTNGRATVYDTSLKPLMNTLQQIQH